MQAKHYNRITSYNVCYTKLLRIFNCGTGRGEPFQNVAEAVVKYHGKGEIEYIPFPDHLKGRYQSFTQADLTKLRATGCDVEFRTVAEGVAAYMAWLNR